MVLTVVCCYENFLTNRTLCTRVGNCMSSELELRSGVTQGSGIGHLLFASYINELADVLGQCNVTVKFFPDDLKMYVEIKTNLEADLFQGALHRLSNWANDWQMFYHAHWHYEIEQDLLH